jgi:hypothetical protein
LQAPRPCAMHVACDMGGRSTRPSGKAQPGEAGAEAGAGAVEAGEGQVELEWEGRRHKHGEG